MTPPKQRIEIPKQNNWKNKRNNVAKVNKNKSKNSERFEYGNYNRYYGYRNTDGLSDPRIDIFNTRRELFYKKDILDVGCNIGHITYLVARDLGAKTILGIDIDNYLINIARKNMPYYNCLTSPMISDRMEKCDLETRNESNRDLRFPQNVSFLHSNYVLHSDDLLAKEEPRYDMIMCLSVTKWIHLNWGDEGLIRVFKRMFLQLRAGGVLILEAQPFESYRKKKLSQKLRLCADKIKLLPSMFENYLISEIGFKMCETLAVPSHTSKGFQRPIKIFFKQ